VSRDPSNPYPPPPWAKVVSIVADQSTDATEREPGVMALGRGAEWPCSVTLPPRPATDYARAFAEYSPPPAPRRIFAAVALDGSGVWAIGDTTEEARAGALDRREYLRDEARSVDCDFPPPETDAAWLDGFAIVTLSGTTESLRALLTSMETGDPVAPWCPADLWDNLEPVKEPPCFKTT
jgi:hypothetical protein